MLLYRETHHNKYYDDSTGREDLILFINRRIILFTAPPITQPIDSRSRQLLNVSKRWFVGGALRFERIIGMLVLFRRDLTDDDYFLRYTSRTRFEHSLILE